jgi:hypothetical protein
MEAVYPSETPVSGLPGCMAEIPEDDTLLIHCCENLKSIMMKSLLVP